MKKRTFTFLLALFATLSLFAADISSRITVSFTGNRDYELRIDGRRYSSNNNRIYLDDLRPGRHQMEVYALNNRGRRTGRPVYASSFILRPQYDLHMAIDRNGQVRMEERRNRARNDRDSRNWNDRDERYDNDRDWRRDDDQRFNPALSERNYNNLVQQVRRQWSAGSKFNAAKEGVTRHYLSTQQVGGLLQLLSAESYRLEVAKLAYRNTVDRHAYGQLYPLFSRGAQAELDNYIRSIRY